MHKYFKEINETGIIIGVCSISYRTNDELNEYKQKCFKTVEIKEKEYDQLRKTLLERSD